MSEIEVHVSLSAETIRVGTLFRQAARGRESVTFQYHEDWLTHPARFSLEPGLAVGKGMFHPGGGREMFVSIGDSAPDTWGRRLMQRAERRAARGEAASTASRPSVSTAPRMSTTCRWPPGCRSSLRGTISITQTQFGGVAASLRRMRDRPCGRAQVLTCSACGRSFRCPPAP